jgi:hypothetical protein
VATLDPALRQRLLKAKLSALVRSHWDDLADSDPPSSFPAGAVLVANRTAWVLAEDAPERSLGPALLLAGRQGAEHLHLLAGEATGSLARRARLVRLPVTVWKIEGANLVEAVAEELPAEPPLPEAAEPFRTLIERAGAEAVVEAGILRAEIKGLEVARVDVDETGPHLAVGVGKYDRELKRMLHGHQQGWPELAEVVTFVATRRVAGGEGSPAFHLAPERWLRSLVVAQPSLAGAARLVPAPPPVVRDDLRQTVPAPAAGEDPEGEPVLVVCSVGIDVDLVAFAADAWLADGRKPRLVLCVPEGDDHPALHELAALLEPPNEVVTVPSNWRALAG